MYIPTAQQMETVLYVGEHRKNTMPDKLYNLPLFYQEEFDIPMVEGCAGWLVCKVILNPHQEEENFDSFMDEIVAAWSVDRVLKTDIGFLMTHLMNCVRCIMSLEVNSTLLAKAQNLITDREKIKQNQLRTNIL